MRKFQVWALVAAAALALLMTVLGRQGMLGEPPAPVATGTPDIGGAFALIDHTGRPVTEADFADQTLLISFGFTFCPDVCPTILQTMASAMDLLGPDGAQVRPMLITVDPDRDTPEVLAAYVRHFHPRMVGLTGTPAQIAAVARAYKVYYAKAPLDENAPDGDYIMDHSSLVFLMGKDGMYRAHFNHATAAEDIAATIRAHL